MRVHWIWVLLLPLAEAMRVSGTTPVNCGDNLNIAGERYILTADLNCSPLSAPAVRITADRVLFDLNGFTINGGGEETTGVAIGCGATEEVQVTGGTIRGFNTAVALCEARNARLSRLLVTGNDRGIALSASHANKIEANLLSNNNTALAVATSNQNQFKRNIIDRGMTGVAVSGLNNTFQSNTIHNFEFAVLVGGDNNIFQKNTGTGNFNGLRMFSSGNSVEGDTWNDNATIGIAASFGSLGNTIRNNTALRNANSDLYDFNSNCGTNVWSRNTFTTSNQSCIQ